MAATDQQVQQFVDTRLRPFCEAIRDLIAQANDIKASIGDVYAAVTEPSPTWIDSRTDGPPHLMTPSDVASLNTVITDLLAYQAGEGQWPIVLKCCVRPVS